MIKFITISSNQKDNDLYVKIIDVETNEVKPITNVKWNQRNVALKILALKVAAYLQWDLDILEKKLPLPIQLIFLQDLFYITTDMIIEIPNLPEFSMNAMLDQTLFCTVLYHRWLLRAMIHRSLNNNKYSKQYLHQ